MRKLLAVSAIALFAAGPVFAQSAGMQTASMPYESPPQPMKAPKGGWPKPIDHGPYTAQANAAYEGGGMILQGAPGAPPPRPQATPPGQVPANMLPQ
jgi:hypothetical protein